MALIDRKDWLSVYGGSQGTAQQAGATDRFGLSAIATFVTTSLVERALFSSQATTTALLSFIIPKN